MNDQFLKPLLQIEKAKPSKGLYKKVEARLFENRIIPVRTLALVAVSILLLLFVNIYALNTVAGTDSQNLEADYQIINDFTIY